MWVQNYHLEILPRQMAILLESHWELKGSVNPGDCWQWSQQEHGYQEEGPRKYINPKNTITGLLHLYKVYLVAVQYSKRQDSDLNTLCDILWDGDIYLVQWLIYIVPPYTTRTGIL